MDKYAIIQLAGRQLMVREGQVFEVTQQKELKPEVLLFSDGDKVEIGSPYVSGVKVDAEILENKKDDKVVVARFKSKSRYRKKKGHRQPISVVKINYIGKGTKSTKKTEEPKKTTTAKKTAEKKATTKTATKKKTTKATAKKTTAKKATPKKKPVKKVEGKAKGN